MKHSRTQRMQRENERLRAALSAIHDRLHANEVDRAHELCECALAGAEVSQPNLTPSDAANSMSFAAAFNALAERYGQRACCISLLPSATMPNGVSLQICGEVLACKLVESQLRGKASTYMGDHDSR